jgi:hypothetical protein
MKKRINIYAFLFLLAVAAAFPLLAQVVSTAVTPVRWVDATGTNFVGIASSSGAPFTLQQGTNSYTGITTNRAVLFGTGITNTLVIKNGLIVGIQ